MRSSGDVRLRLPLADGAAGRSPPLPEYVGHVDCYARLKGHVICRRRVAEAMVPAGVALVLLAWAGHARIPSRHRRPATAVTRRCSSKNPGVRRRV